MRCIAILLTLQALVAVAPSEAAACVCGVNFPPTRAERLEAVRRQLASADAVFVGEFVSTDGQAVTVKVIRSWKGAGERTIRLREASRVISADRIEFDNCALGLGQGQYLIFASKTVGNVMYASKCSSGKVKDQKETLELLDAIGGGKDGPGQPPRHAS